MDNVILFGLSSFYKKHKKSYNTEYNVIAVTDNNSNKSLEYSNYIRPIEINSYSYDYIIITSNFYMDIIYQLVYDINIDINKIIIAQELYQLGASSYSQCSEDLIVLTIFRLLNKKINDIYYVDIGANQPIKLSNTYQFYKYGAHGVLVEANPKLIPGLEVIRSRDIVINKAIVCNDEKNIKLYISNHDTMSTTNLQQFYNGKVEGTVSKETNIVDEIIIEAININALFSNLEKQPDILSIDIEGEDFNVIRSLDFETYNPFIIIIEKSDFEYDICSYLENNDYKYLISTSINSIFIKNI